MTARDGPRDAGAAVSRADEMLGRHEFQAARTAYEGLIAERESAANLEGLASACRFLDDIAAAVGALERAYLLRVKAGQLLEAARVACTLADLELTELGGSAVASGWLARARHHLQGDPDDPVHVVLEALCAYRALAYEKDPDTARAFAAKAVAHAQRSGDSEAEIMSQAFLGFTEVSLGELPRGFARLDEATTAALAGELPPPADLDVYCLLISACERVRDFDRVDQWARRVLALATTAGSDSFAAFARTQYAGLLVWRGQWQEADDEIERVLTDAVGRPMTAALGMVLRASLRRRQGRLDDALEELSAAEREPYRRAVRHLVLAVRARIELDRGEAQVAADLAERYLRAVSPSDVIERIDALETLVRARLALGDLDAAEVATAALESTAAVIPTDAVRGAAVATRAEVSRARGELAAARDGLEEAAALFDAAGLVHDAVLVRVGLAEVLLGLGRTQSAGAVAAAARDDGVALGAAREVAAANRVLGQVRGRPESAMTGMTPRELEILRLVADGLTNAQIAELLVLSPRTVERHVSNIYLKVGATGPSARTISVAHARRAGLLS